MRSSALSVVLAASLLIIPVEPAFAQCGARGKLVYNPLSKSLECVRQAAALVTAATLDAVTGASNLATANRIVVVSSAGVATQTAYLDISPGGDLRFISGKGQHIQTQAAASDLSGTITISNPATTGSVSFTTAYSSAPACTLTPTTNQIAVIVTWWVTTSTSAVTAHVAVSPLASIVFHYHCIGNPD